MWLFTVAFLREMCCPMKLLEGSVLIQARFSLNHSPFGPAPCKPVVMQFARVLHVRFELFLAAAGAKLCKPHTDV
jgi:hypothetical protein